MKKQIDSSSRPIYSEVQPNISSMPDVATIEASSPWKNADVSFNYVRVDYPKLHTHYHWELLIILSGSVTHEINGELHSLTKGDACLIRPQDCHRLMRSSATETGSYQHLNFLIRTDYLQQQSQLLDSSLYDELIAYPGILSFTVSDRLLNTITKKTISMQASNVFSPENHRSCKLIFQELYIYFLDRFLSPPTAYPDWLLQFLVLLQDVNSFYVPVSQLAKATPYSYSRLIRIFKEYMGVSLVDYLTDVKIEYAKSLLKSTNQTMLAIASQLEFSISYFNKLFKKKVGVTPGEYRKTHRKSR